MGDTTIYIYIYICYTIIKYNVIWYDIIKDIEYIYIYIYIYIKGMQIHHTKMGCLSWQWHKTQSEINKSMERNQCQENYHSTQGHFVCQPITPSVKESAIHINWLQANDVRWKALDEVLSFILRKSLKGSFGVKLNSFTKIIHAVCLDRFGAADVQYRKTIWTTNRRWREKGRLRVEQKLLKKWLREMPDDRELVKKNLSEVKERILVIARTENASMWWLEKRKARHNFDKNPFKFTKKLFDGEKNEVLNIPKEDLEMHLQKKYTNPLADIPLGHISEHNEITSPSMKAFMDDVTRRRIQITHGTTGNLITRALQMGCHENKAFKMPQFINN